MNKILNIIKYILLLIVIILTVLTINETSLLIEMHPYIILIIIYLILSIKDIIKKDKINQNKKYNILSIIVFVIIIIIFLRFLYDPNFIHNNKTLLDELKYYDTTLYEDKIFSINHYEEVQIIYIAQNMIYFDLMFVLLLVYRIINKGKKT